MLELHLADELGEEAKVYCDVIDERPGNRWPETLADAHAASCVIVPVLCHGFFRSGWCMSEWNNAYEREQLVREASGTAPMALVPIRFNDVTDDHVARLPQGLRDQVKSRLRADFGKTSPGRSPCSSIHRTTDPSGLRLERDLQVRRAAAALA